MRYGRAALAILVVLVLAACATPEEQLANDPGPEIAGEVHTEAWPVLGGETEGGARMRWLREHPGCEIVRHVDRGAGLVISYVCEGGLRWQGWRE